VRRKRQRENRSEIVTHMFMIQKKSEEHRAWNPGDELKGDPTLPVVGAPMNLRKNMIPERTPRNTRLPKDLPINTRQVNK